MCSRPKKKKLWKEASKERIIRTFLGKAFPIIRRPFSSYGALAEPLRRNIDYQSVGRKTFLTDKLELPKCGSCDKFVGSGADSGCRECLAFRVLDC